MLPQDAFDFLVTDTLCVLKLKAWSTRDSSYVKQISILQCRENVLQLKPVHCAVRQFFVQSFVRQTIRKRKSQFVYWRQ